MVRSTPASVTHRINSNNFNQDTGHHTKFLRFPQTLKANSHHNCLPISFDDI
jgi:hypothetical protein